MARAKTVWGIDIGQCALKALKLRNVDGELQVEAFDIIEHASILSEPEVDRSQLIRGALEQFLARNDIAGSPVAISVPGQASFTRFVKLPPVDLKKIPDIVRFEAEQQIPFPMEEVIWRWQTFQDPDSPDIEAGIFAMKRVDISEMLSHFTGVDLSVEMVQIAPLALYNFMLFDKRLAGDGATLLVDVGAEKTDLVVADGARIWIRTIQIGGNNFTEALVRAFKLSFPKAEKLKRTAATSKYARQIFQAMRPVFSDLVQEIQRSVGYYTSLHRETRFKKLVGMGNGFRLPGLQKFLEQNLGMPVGRIDSYNRLTPSPGINEPRFNESVLSLGVVYGLAVQALDLSRVDTNLLPKEIARRSLWSRKRPWFAAAAAVALLALAGITGRSYMDRKVLANRQLMNQARGISSELNTLLSKYKMVVGQGTQEEEQLKWHMKLFGYHDFWPSVQTLISKSIQSVATDQTLLAGGGDALKALQAKPRNTRKVVIIEKLEQKYFADLSTASFSTGRPAAHNVPLAAAIAGGEGDFSPGMPAESPRGFLITLTGRTPLPRAQANAMLSTLLRDSVSFAAELKSLSIAQAEIIDLLPMSEPTRGAARPAVGMAGPMGMPAPAGATADAGPAMPDPLFPDEDMSNDTRFVIGWMLTIEGDGVSLPNARTANGGEYGRTR